MNYTSAHINTATTTVITTQPCILHTLTLNNAPAGYVSLFHTLQGSIDTGQYDYITAIDPLTAAQTFTYDIVCKQGLVIVTDEADSVTVAYAPIK